MRSVFAGACGAALLALALSATPVRADERHGGARAEHVDARHGHNHYYPDRGGFVRAVPGRPFVVGRGGGGGGFFYSGGVWYAPRGPSFVVVAAPVGVFVPVLPPFYTTLWIGGLPYYYANDTYYVWRDAQDGYEVVDPPGDPGASTQSPPGEAPPGDDLYIYPQNGQPADRQASDKYECHKWASAQTGFDPTRSEGGVPPEQAQLKRADYQRAMRACLEGRGYSVR